jgi:hypothetical protein
MDKPKFSQFLVNNGVVDEEALYEALIMQGKQQLRSKSLKNQLIRSAIDYYMVIKYGYKKILGGYAWIIRN